MPQGKKYINDLDPRKRYELCKILDADGSWYELGSDMKFQWDDLSLIRNRAATVSPTDILLQKYSHGNHTISELFYLLFKRKNHRALLILKSEVPEKYHRFIEEGRSCDSTLFSPGSSRSDLPSFRDSCSAMTLNVPPSTNSVDGSRRSRASQSRSSSRLPTSELLQGATARLRDSNERDILLNKMSAEKDKSPLPDKHVSAVYNGSKDKGRQIEQERSRRTSNTDNRLNKETASTRSGTTKEMNQQQSMKKDREKVDEWVNDIEATMHIPYKEILAATNSFSNDSILGAGGFGKVYKGVWRENQIAVKKLTHRAKGDLTKMLVTELRPLCRFRHNNILLVYGFSIGECEDDTPCLVYQLMPNGSLDDRLQQKGGTPPLNWEQRFYIAEGTAAGLNYLHTQKSEQPVVHGDIKSANILLDKNMEPKLGDFGLARDGPKDAATHVDVSTLQGTRPYLPPEYLKSKQLSVKVDVYSYGVVLMEIATGLRPHDKDRPKNDHHLWNMVMDTKDIKRLRDDRPGEDTFLIFDFLLPLGKKCASERKNDRLDMNEVLKEFALYNTVKKDRKKALELLYASKEIGEISPLTRQAMYDCKPSEIPSPLQGMPFSSYGGGSLPLNDGLRMENPVGHLGAFSPIHTNQSPTPFPYGIPNFQSYPTGSYPYPSPTPSPPTMYSNPGSTPPNRSFCPSPLASPNWYNGNYSNPVMMNGQCLHPEALAQPSYAMPQQQQQFYPTSIEQINQSLRQSFPYGYPKRGPPQPSTSFSGISTPSAGIPTEKSMPTEAPRSCGQSVVDNEEFGPVPMLTALGMKTYLDDDDDEPVSAKGKSSQICILQSRRGDQ